jgi:RNA polymerase sigma-70 factor (ECF subfamily)
LPNDQRIQPPADRHSAAADSGSKITPDMARRLRALDPEALGLFYNLYFDRVHGYVRRMVGDEHTAEDVTQDIFMHIQRALQSYDPSRELDPWVFTIASNKLRDHWRSRRHREGMRETSLEEDETRFHPASTQRGPLPEMENEELGRQLSRAIDELPESMRETLILRYFEGLSFENIAAMLERNEAAVRKRYSRALEELRRSLQKTLGGAGGRP